MTAATLHRPALRRCIVTSQPCEKAGLIRFVRTPEGGVMADIAGKLPGRGAWVTADIEIVRKAVAGGKLARHLGKDAGRTQINAEFLFENLAFQVSRQLSASLSMLRRAGRLVLGRMAIEQTLHPSGLLVADDASRRETASLISKLQPDWTEYGLPADMLGSVASRTSLAYAAVILDRAGATDVMTDRLLADIAHWRAFGTCQPDKTGADGGCHAG
jgi:predicted RNA-binding protein YlxR (DUF448 family)